EGRQVLGAPVVGEASEPQPLQHRGPLLGPSLLGVKRDDAPGDQVRPAEQLAGRRRRVVGDGREGRSEPEQHHEAPRKQLQLHHSGPSPPATSTHYPPPDRTPAVPRRKRRGRGGGVHPAGEEGPAPPGDTSGRLVYAHGGTRTGASYAHIVPPARGRAAP